MLKRIATMLWGKFDSKGEFQKFLFLASIFSLIIGAYWALRPIKDSIFASVIGGDYLPIAKMVSLCVIVPLIILYGKLVDTYPRHKVFYTLLSVYGVLAIFFAWGFMHPTVGLANSLTSPYRVIGWVWYVWVESFGSLIVALFWAITTDITMPESAKRGFPIIALLGQLGNILGPWILNTRTLGFANSAPIIGICGILMFSVVLLFWVFMRVTPQDLLVGYAAEETEDKEPGFFEGLKLLLTHGYLIGLFLIISIYEVIVTIIDNHFKQTVFAFYKTEAARAAYLSDYAFWTGILATLCVLLGINNIQRKLGMTVSLMLLPALVTLAVVIIKFNPMAIQIAFWIMVCSKAVNYALNQPTLKQLYIPTSKNTKYKSQAWIEMFGSRGSKATGSVVNLFRTKFVNQYGLMAGLNTFLTMSSFISFGLVGVWVFVALYVARSYNKAIEENKVVC